MRTSLGAVVARAGEVSKRRSSRQPSYRRNHTTRRLCVIATAGDQARDLHGGRSLSRQGQVRSPRLLSSMHIAYLFCFRSPAAAVLVRRSVSSFPLSPLFSTNFISVLSSPLREDPGRKHAVHRPVFAQIFVRFHLLVIRTELRTERRWDWGKGKFIILTSCLQSDLDCPSSAVKFSNCKVFGPDLSTGTNSRRIAQCLTLPDHMLKMLIVHNSLIIRVRKMFPTISSPATAKLSFFFFFDGNQDI